LFCLQNFIREKRGLLSDVQGNQLIQDSWQDKQGPEEAEVSRKTKGEELKSRRNQTSKR
jgi:hypothetical protein